MADKNKICIFWFRRDLRLSDNTALYHALKSGLPVLPIFIFDTNILNELPAEDKRVLFIHDSLKEIREKLAIHNSSIWIRHTTPEKAIKELMAEYDIDSVYCNEDYEPYATARDESIRDLLKQNNTKFYRYKDQVIFSKSDIVKENGEPYTVYTPYSKKWKSNFDLKKLEQLPSEKNLMHLAETRPLKYPGLESMGFKKSEFDFPSSNFPESIIDSYTKTRDFPGIRGTSHLGMHLRFGTISIRSLVKKAYELSDTFLGELVWREFFQMILWHFPSVVTHAFKPAYDKIKWVNNEKEFDRWCKGNTGYPIVDAGMRELNTSGFMHNRVRMITASFLCKHLLIDWRWGEAYFAEKLLDYELASNNGNWQWCAGSGCDAAPYFRIFNPYLQTKKFDPDLTYIRKWVPEFEDEDYPKPMVDHNWARDRCLEVYSKALKQKKG